MSTLGQPKEEFTCQLKECGMTFKLQENFQEHFLSHSTTENSCSSQVNAEETKLQASNNLTSTQIATPNNISCEKTKKKGIRKSRANKNKCSLKLPLKNTSEDNEIEDNGSGNLKAALVVYEQFRRFSFPYFYSSKSLPLPRQLRENRDVLEHIHSSYIQFTNRNQEQDYQETCIDVGTFVNS